MGIETARYARYTGLHRDQITALQRGDRHTLLQLTDMARAQGFSHQIVTIQPGALPNHLPLYYPHLTPLELSALLGLCKTHPEQETIMISKYVGSTPGAITQCIIKDGHLTDQRALEQYPSSRRRRCPVIIMSKQEIEQTMGLGYWDLVRKKWVHTQTKHGSKRAPVSFVDMVTDKTATIPLDPTCWAHFALSPVGALDRGSS